MNKRNLPKPQPKGLSKRVLVFLAFCAAVITLGLIWQGRSARHPETPTLKPTQSASAKTETSIGGPIGQSLDAIEATLASGLPAIGIPIPTTNAPVAQVGARIHDSGGTFTLAPLNSKPPEVVSEEAMRKKYRK